MLKKAVKSFLFPPFAVMLVLLPVSTVVLIFSFVYLGTKTVTAYVSYALAFYTLTVWCLKIPNFIKTVKAFKNENKYAKRWLSDPHLRVTVSLYGTLIWNTAYAVFQLTLGLRHRSFWYYSMAGYYISLAFMRFFLARHTRKHKPGERMKEELMKFRACGIVFLIMNLALTGMIFFMVYRNKTFHHHEITAIAMALYTFVTFIMSIVNVIRYSKLGSPVFTASKIIGLAAACVSILTLESTMLTAFGNDTVTPANGRIMLGISGGAVSLFIIGMAIFMIVQSSKKIRLLKTVKE